MKQIIAAVESICQKLFNVRIVVELTRPDPAFGDFATNVALQLAKKLSKNPREVATTIANELKTSLSDQVSEVTVAGPGFINLRLTDAVLLSQLESVLDQPTIQAKKTVLVEYSDPNPFKPLHAGHLYTTLVGNMIARLVEQGGATVVRTNYSGDVGLHVGKAMWAILQTLGGEQTQKLDQLSKSERAQWLGQRYVEGNTAYEDDEAAKAEIVATNKRVYELHARNDHDSPFAQIYWTCRQWSYDYFAELYTQLGVDSFDRYIPESEVTELGVATVRKQLAKGVYTESQGAVVFEGEAQGLHTRVFINSAGLPTYEAKEIGLIQTKWNDYHYDQSIVITANEQAQYMQVVLASVAQFEPELVERTRHITHGVVKLTGGVKMSSRKGNTVSAVDIIESAQKAAEEQGRGADASVVLAAIKYAFAKNRIGGDIIYDPKESIALEGNSGPYLQYAHARARSILQKSSVTEAKTLVDLVPGERVLASKLTEYPEVVASAVESLSPHLICTYLYELAQVSNRFYEQSRVIGDPREAQRLTLVATYADVLKAGLELLGIQAPEKM